MALTSPPNHLLLFENTKMRSTFHVSALSVDHGAKLLENSKNALLISKRSKERIKKMLNKVDLSVSSYDTAWVASSYDTAWVAMVPSHTSPESPYFPECVNWLLENQLPDGSWGLPDGNPFLVKDTLLSTLASILALKKWNIGEEHVNKGLHFITSNFSSIANEKQHNPIGFDIIFPGMIEYAQEMGINFHLGPTTLNYILQKRDSELNRGSKNNHEGRKLYLAYIAEGLGKSQDWKSIMKYQRKNGSLFNSPSTTAAALAHLQDINCLNYLHSILDVFGNYVPTAYPLEIYTQLCMVDDLESLGISRHFKKEIGSVLDRTYSCWLMKDEEIFLDTATCAMAFRILRAHGYDVSLDVMLQFSEEDFSNTLGGYVKDTGVVLELYRASHFAFPDELFLEEQKMWSGQYLKWELSKSSMHADRQYECISNEVDVALSYPNYANLQRLENRRRLEHYDVDNLRILKSSYRPANVDKKVILELAIEDFNLCQSIQQKELKQLERWVEENRLDKLTFARQKQEYCYFSAAATLFPPELFDARMSWAKNSVLTTVVDDFYDGGGSREELLNLIELVEKWDGVSATDICSEQVEILFNAIRNTINEVGEMAMKYQHRNVTRHITEIWLSFIKSVMKEAEWLENGTIPTIDEYSRNAYISFGSGPIIIPALYVVGPYLSDEVFRTPEFDNLFRLTGTCGRNLNDIQGFKRESKEGKLNGIALHMLHDPSVTTEEEAVKKMRRVIESSRKELMRLVVQTNGSVVPRVCKELFWNMCRVVHLFYASNDGFSSAEQMVTDVKAVIFIPLKHE
uniref:Ent-13-epi-sandaracopimaradie n=1 Tax=Aconitum carmichaelii TaxID=85363 RepID=A0A8E8P0C0_ACOCM|nr:ent-13-epi-sandaracopimaradie [Aconitum carmichaelii]